ncbi:MAG: enoyl-CoA hydratase-related protein [Syntrophales bacterium]|nr:enoyl-CoA hydratase-related protein [Syntrophales bacterium]
MEYKNILFTVEDGVATVTFNRPKALNAMNSETMAELLSAVTHCKNDDGIRVLILTGAGEKAFVAGADISEMQEMKPYQALAFMEICPETDGHARFCPQDGQTQHQFRLRPCPR